MYSSYSARKANFTQARAACAALSGSLVMWKDAESQYSVERYLYQSKALAKYYWMGVSRARLGMAFSYMDGSTLSPTVSNAKPYAHWWGALAALAVRARVRGCIRAPTPLSQS